MENIKASIALIKAGKQELDSQFQELVQYFLLPQNANKNKRGVPSIGYWAVEQLAAYLYTALTHPSNKWFNFKPIEEVGEEGMKWIQDTENNIYSAFISPETFFNNQMHEFYLELVGIGTAVMYLEEDANSPYGIHFLNLPIKQCYIKENYKGEVDTLVREFILSADEIMKKFDIKNKDFTDNPNKEYTISHYIRPEGSAFISSYYVLQNNILLQEKVLAEAPFIVARWNKKNHTPYGVAQTMIALNEIKKLEQFEKILIKQAHYAIEPAWFLPSADVQYPIDRNPAGINYFKAGAEKGYTMPSSSNINIGEWLLKQKEDTLSKCFYLDIIHSLNKANMTATEVNQRVSLYTKILSPITSRIESEFLRPLIFKTFSMMMKYGKIKASSVRIKELKFEFISALARGRKYEEMNEIYKVIDVANSVAKVNPESIDIINWDRTLKKLVELSEAPLTILNKDKHIAEIRENRRQQMQQQQQQQQ